VQDTVLVQDTVMQHDDAWVWMGTVERPLAVGLRFTCLTDIYLQKMQFTNQTTFEHNAPFPLGVTAEITGSYTCKLIAFGSLAAEQVETGHVVVTLHLGA